MQAQQSTGQGKAGKTTTQKRMSNGCGCLIVLIAFVGFLLLMNPPGSQPTIVSNPGPATHSAKNAVPATPAVTRKYTAVLDHKKDGIKLVLNVALEAELDDLPNEMTLERISRRLFQEWGGANYERMFLNFQIPELDPIPSVYWAQAEFNPDFKVKIMGASPEDGKWLASQRGKPWDGSGEVVGRWYWLGGGRIRTIVKEGNNYTEYWSFRNHEEPQEVDAYGWNVKKVDGRLRFRTDHIGDADFYWYIDGQGRWCEYSDGKLASVELPLGEVKAEN